MIKNDKTGLPGYLFVLVLLLIVFSLVQSGAAVAAPLPQGEDIAVITSPSSNAVIQGVVQIVGSADYPSFQFYVVDFTPEPVTGDQWNTIGTTHNSPVINGVLETWDTTGVPDGSYTIRLRVVRLDGNYSEDFVQQVVVNNTQPLPTNTPAETTPEVTAAPTTTPTPLPPTPTIVIEQPVVDTPTPRPVATVPPLEDPDEESLLIPTVTGFSVGALSDACLYGAAIMLSIFLFFGFLAALRLFIRGFIDRMQKR